MGYASITERKELESQLCQTQKIEAIGTLAGGIAHDFNNILAVLFLHTELAQSDAEPGSELWESLQTIQTVAERAKDLVHQILTFSRQVETRRHPARVSAVIQETLGLLRASLPATVKMEQTFPEAGDTIMIDPTQLHQIVLNLCSNAEYAMRDIGGLLTIGVDTVAIDHTLSPALSALPYGSYVRVTIRDTGHGMTPDIMERIFDPFFTTKEVGEGTGMGLAVVHGIVVQAGGEITADSTPGEGTTFALYFPRVQEDEVSSINDPNTLPCGTGRLLLVDDEILLTQGVHKLLEQLGYEVVSCTSSLKALDIFRGDPYSFDLLITDQTMPQMTGDKLAQAVRRIRTDMPIILCTGFSHTMDRDKARELGVDAFCLKPLTIRELGGTIQRVLQHRAAQVPSLAYPDADHFRHDARG